MFRTRCTVLGHQWHPWVCLWLRKCSSESWGGSGWDFPSVFVVFVMCLQHLLHTQVVEANPLSRVARTSCRSKPFITCHTQVVEENPLSCVWIAVWISSNTIFLLSPFVILCVWDRVELDTFPLHLYSHPRPQHLPEPPGGQGCPEEPLGMHLCSGGAWRSRISTQPVLSPGMNQTCVKVAFGSLSLKGDNSHRAPTLMLVIRVVPGLFPGTSSAVLSH